MRILLQVDCKFSFKTFWAVACISLFMTAIADFLATPVGETENLLYYLTLMLLLNFPASLVSILVANVIPSSMPFLANSWLIWLSMFVAGYLQWFVIVPAMKRSGITKLDLTKACSTEVRKRHGRRKRRQKLHTYRPDDFANHELSPIQRVFKS